MKKSLLFISIIFSGAVAQAQTSPELTKTSYLTNLTGRVMQAYPNPASDQVTIQHVSSPNRAVISIISTDGRVLLHRTVVPNTLQTQFSVGILSKGMYLLRFDDGKGDVRTTRLIKD